MVAGRYSCIQQLLASIDIEASPYSAGHYGTNKWCLPVAAFVVSGRRWVSAPARPQAGNWEVP